MSESFVGGAVAIIVFEIHSVKKEGYFGFFKKPLFLRYKIHKIPARKGAKLILYLAAPHSRKQGRKERREKKKRGGKKKKKEKGQGRARAREKHIFFWYF